MQLQKKNEFLKYCHYGTKNVTTWMFFWILGTQFALNFISSSYSKYALLCCTISGTQYCSLLFVVPLYFCSQAVIATAAPAETSDFHKMMLVSSLSMKISNKISFCWVSSCVVPCTKEFQVVSLIVINLEKNFTLSCLLFPLHRPFRPFSEQTVSSHPRWLCNSAKIHFPLTPIQCILARFLQYRPAL